MQKMIAGGAASSPAWDALETFARSHVQEFVQQLLEDEVTELLGRVKSARRGEIEPATPLKVLRFQLRILDPDLNAQPPWSPRCVRLLSPTNSDGGESHSTPVHKA